MIRAFLSKVICSFVYFLNIILQDNKGTYEHTWVVMPRGNQPTSEWGQFDRRQISQLNQQITPDFYGLSRRLLLAEADTEARGVDLPRLGLLGAASGELPLRAGGAHRMGALVNSGSVRHPRLAPLGGALHCRLPRRPHPRLRLNLLHLLCPSWGGTYFSSLTNYLIFQNFNHMSMTDLVKTALLGPPNALHTENVWNTGQTFQNNFHFTNVYKSFNRSDCSKVFLPLKERNNKLAGGIFSGFIWN